MMKITEKVAYLKGLLDGMSIDKTTNEGKLFSAIIDTLEDMAFEITENTEVIVELGHHVDIIDEDLSLVEEDLYDDYDDEDYDDDDDDCGCGCGCGCGDDDEELIEGPVYEIICPTCSDSIFLDKSMAESGQMTCPNCGESLEFDIDEAMSEEE